MAKNFTKKNTEEENLSIFSLSAVISKDTIIKGNVYCSGILRIDGKIIGNIIGNCKIYISEKAEIIGDIYANEIITSGKIMGDIYIRNKVSALKSSFINGNVTTNKFYGEEGMVLKGKVKATDDSNLNSIVEEAISKFNKQ